MKPRLFIGSSVESLKTARAIQDNLEYDCHSTVWNQGIFDLSKSALENLLNALENFDFAVFVFEPNDVTLMRDDKKNTVRDNVIFEFGLFVGKLGRDRVFFVTPRNGEPLHLPTDLLGIVAGSYDVEHTNINAAVGTFSNQVREKLQAFVYQNMDILANEPQAIKKIAVERPIGWEYKLASALLKNRFLEIDRIIYELDHGLFIKRSCHQTLDEFRIWFQELLADFQNLIHLFSQTLNVELIKAFGELGEPGNINSIKYCIDKLRDMSFSLLEWEKEIRTITPPDDVLEAKEALKNSSITLINELRKLYEITDEFFLNFVPNGEMQTLDIKFKIDAPSGLEKAAEVVRRAYGLV